MDSFILFTAGIMIGLIVYPLVRMLESEGIDRTLDSIGRIMVAPFLPLIEFIRKKNVLRKARQGLKTAMVKHVDAREQQISDSVQSLRSIMLSLALMIQKTDQATADSSHVLEGLRKSIDQSSLPPDLANAHSLLLAEIDRVIVSNAVLKSELASSQSILETQKRQIEDLKTAVRIDGLTQLANRSFFDEKLIELIKMKQRYDEKFSLMMIDIDNFKEINDQHGHLSGDRILKGVTFRIKSDLRESDFIARFGGDEFAILIIKAGRQAAIDLAWKICTNIRESRFMLDKTEFKVTVSIGVAESIKGETAESLIKRADKALYLVKEYGRNGVDADDATSDTTSAD